MKTGKEKLILVVVCLGVMTLQIPSFSGELKESTEMRSFGKEAVEVIYRDVKRPEQSGGIFPELSPGVSVEEGGIICERDVAVKMRDGIVIYTDIYRPQGETNLPAIVAWSPYGKRFLRKGRPLPGIPPGAVSPMAKLEAPDPAYWCRYGYAVINPDARGIGYSQGDVAFWGTQEGRDGYDLIEWVAGQKWCNGKVALSGNSWLGILQWFIAVEKPPHLAAIAPWEGFDDAYRNCVCIGGIPETGFRHWTGENMAGLGRRENVTAMVRKYPLMNGYWEDKIARVERIEIPAYVVASYTNPIHTKGTFDAYRRLASQDKWLRVHNTYEWPDYYTPEHLEDLRRFFDRFLKGIRNGWELTPRVRLSVLDPGGTDIIDRVENEWPLARAEHRKLFLDAAKGTLSPDPVSKESFGRYPVSNENFGRGSDDSGQAVFTMTFDKDVEIVGYSKLRLWVEADGSDDMDLFVDVFKGDSEGNRIPAYVLGRPDDGTQGGRLRVSHRELDEARSTPSEPYHTHRSEQLLKPGEIVPVDIGLWPMGMRFHAGQKLCITVGGHYTWKGDLALGIGPIFKYETRNKGHHIIHTGGRYDSHLLVSVIPK